jgi:hypothetical protein
MWVDLILPFGALISLAGSLFFTRKAITLLKGEAATENESSQGFIVVNYVLGSLVAAAALLISSVLENLVPAYGEFAMGPWALQMIVASIFFEALYGVVCKKTKYDHFPKLYWKALSRSGSYGSLAVWFAIASMFWDIA